MVIHIPILYYKGNYRPSPTLYKKALIRWSGPSRSVNAKSPKYKITRKSETNKAARGAQLDSHNWALVDKFSSASEVWIPPTTPGSGLACSPQGLVQDGTSAARMSSTNPAKSTELTPLSCQIVELRKSAYSLYKYTHTHINAYTQERS